MVTFHKSWSTSSYLPCQEFCNLEINIIALIFSLKKKKKEKKERKREEEFLNNMWQSKYICILK